MGAVIQAGAMALFLVLGQLWPREGISPFSRDTFINLLTGASLFGLKVAVLWAVGSLSPLGLIALEGIEHPVLQFLLVFILGDLARYWLHRAHHEVAFLWQFHRTHHSSEQLNATSGLRMHVVDFVQLSLVPIVLYGVVLDTRSFDPRIWLALGAVIAVMDAFQHADLRFPLTNPLSRAWYRVFNSPHFHSWHHTQAPDKVNANYGQTLVLWDYWFGTAVDESEPCHALGLTPDQALEISPLGLQLLRVKRPG